MTDTKLIGNDDNGGTDVVGGNYYFFQKFTCGASKNLNSIHVKCNADMHVMVALYSDASSSPGTVLASSGSTAIVSGVNAVNVTVPYAVTNGTIYWLAFAADSSHCLKNTAAVTGYLKYITGGYNNAAWVNNPTGLTSNPYQDNNCLSGWGSAASGASVGHIGFGLVGPATQLKGVLVGD